MTENQSLISQSKEASDLCQMIIECGGELTPEIEARLDANTKSLSQKIDSYWHFEKRVETEIEHFKKLADEITGVVTRLRRSHERLRENIKTSLRIMDAVEIKGNQCRYRISRLPDKVVIDDQSLLPEYCLQKVITKTPIKNLIKDILEDGKEKIEGAHLEPVFSLRSYPDRG